MNIFSKLYLRTRSKLLSFFLLFLLILLITYIGYNSDDRKIPIALLIELATFVISVAIIGYGKYKSENRDIIYILTGSGQTIFSLFALAMINSTLAHDQSGFSFEKFTEYIFVLLGVAIGAEFVASGMFEVLIDEPNTELGEDEISRRFWSFLSPRVVFLLLATFIALIQSHDVDDFLLTVCYLPCMLFVILWLLNLNPGPYRAINASGIMMMLGLAAITYGYHVSTVPNNALEATAHFNNLHAQSDTSNSHSEKSLYLEWAMLMAGFDLPAIGAASFADAVKKYKKFQNINNLTITELEQAINRSRIAYPPANDNLSPSTKVLAELREEMVHQVLTEISFSALSRQQKDAFVRWRANSSE